MARFLKKREKTRGEIPGTPVFIGTQKTDRVRLQLIEYNSTRLAEHTPENVEELGRWLPVEQTTWLNVDGVHDVDAIHRIAELLKLHPLVLEDIVNTDQRPRVEEYDDCLFLAFKMLSWDETERAVTSEHLSAILKGDLLITFQERPGDVFDPVRERIRKHRGRVRDSSTTYLLYILLDTLADNYTYLVERLGEQIEDLEEDVLGNTDSDVLKRIFAYKGEMNFIRKAVRPVRECAMQLVKLESDLVDPEVDAYWRDLLDIVTQASEAIDTYREMLSDQLGIYHSSVSTRLNDVMRVLTLFAAVFIPLTFVAGVYGTNFPYVPIFQLRYGYFIFWGVLVAITAVTVWFFKRKKWM